MAEMEPSSSRRLSTAASVALAAVLFAIPRSLHAAPLHGEISGAGSNRTPIAVVRLAPISAPEPALEEEFRRIVADDLEISGLYKVVDPASYIEGVPPGPLGPEHVNFLNWQAVGARGVVLGHYEKTGSDLAVEVAYLDVGAHSMVGGKRFRGPASDVARMAHRTADAVMEFTTGTPGPFDSRIAFVSNRGGFAKEINVFTFDGEITRVTNHHTVTMAPSWSVDSGSIVFTSFRGGAPSLYSVTLAGRAEKQLATKMGVNVGGAWKPDGSSLALAREEGGNTDIYLLNFASQEQKRLTDHWGIDVDPAWNPDGSRLAFCSSRGGTPQVYTMAPSPGSEATRITFGGSYNCAPSWSPDGHWIAYAGRVGRDFHIFIVPATGGEPRQLTFTGSNEDPTWSPDSRYVVFAREAGGDRKLYLVDLTGRWERELTTGKGDDSSPSWSKRLD